MRSSAIFALVILPAVVRGQESAALKNVLERLERLEEQNRALTSEVQALRQQLAAHNQTDGKPVEERLEVQAARLEELAQTKVEASQKTPISVTGMALFNAFLNGSNSGAQENPTIAAPFATPRTGGGTLRQSVLGLQFRSPQTVFGANVNGSILFDFFASPPSDQQPFRPGNDPAGDGYLERAPGAHLNHLARLRIASLELEWKNQTLMVGQEKPLISIRDPDSLAQVGVSPLTAAGNPWLWQPQVRFEQRFAFSRSTSLHAQFALFQTAETAAGVPEAFADTLESSRPGFETRFLFRYAGAGDRHVEVAPGFHTSTTHVAGTSVPSRLYTVDWSVAPWSKLIFTGLFFSGQNTAHFGTLRQGFLIDSFRNVRPVHSNGGWGQLAFIATPRLTFHAYGGQQDDRNRDLRSGGVGKNLAYAGNAMYRIAPNVIVSFEAIQLRTQYVNFGKRLNNRYDIALAYLF